MAVHLVGRSWAVWVGGWMPSDDFNVLLPLLPPGSGEGEMGLSLYLLEVAAVPTTLQQGNLQMR